MSVEKLSDGIYLCSHDEVRPLMPGYKPKKSRVVNGAWCCPICGEIIDYKVDYICPKCHRAINWEEQ